MAIVNSSDAHVTVKDITEKGEPAWRRYECTKCGHKFFDRDNKAGISRQKDLPACPLCGNFHA